MRHRLGVVALLGCLALASCGTDGGGLGPVEIPAVVDDPAGIYRPGRAANPVALDWDDARASADGRRVTLHFIGGIKGGWSLDRVTVQGEAARVVVTLFGGYHPLPAGSDWPLVGGSYTVTVALADPLRGRSIVDGAAPY